MASYQLQAKMPAVTLDAGCTITFEAIDPSTGAAIAGVTVSQVAIQAVNAITPQIDGEADALFAYPAGDLPAA